MSIPKIIHYCWFGKSEMPVKEQECVSTWKKYFPNYEFILWNENNFDYQSCDFAAQAYEVKKYAFVSDYARAKVLYEYGGVYLDTDFKILKDFRNLLEDVDGVVGFERKAFIGTAIIACTPKNEFIEKLLVYYKTNKFIQSDGSLDNIANVSILTDIIKEYGLELGGKRQKVKDFEVYNREYFYPKKLSDSTFNITEDTVGIHMCSNSWMTERERKRGNNKIWIEFVRPILRKLRSVGIKILGKDRIRKIEIKFRNFLK